jgi:hypothetical protein
MVEHIPNAQLIMYPDASRHRFVTPGQNFDPAGN